MNSSQRIGRLIFIIILVVTALLFVGGIVATIWLAVRQPDLGNIGRLAVIVGTATIAVSYSARSFQRGQSHLRWTLFTILILSGTFLIIVGRLAATPLA